jgi:hypothetical protein
MSENTPTNPVPVTAEEQSRPVFRLLAKAAILLARLHDQSETPAEPVSASGDEKEAGDA